MKKVYNLAALISLTMLSIFIPVYANTAPEFTSIAIKIVNNTNQTLNYVKTENVTTVIVNKEVIPATFVMEPLAVPPNSEAIITGTTPVNMDGIGGNVILMDHTGQELTLYFRVPTQMRPRTPSFHLISNQYQSTMPTKPKYNDKVAPKNLNYSEATMVITVKNNDVTPEN